MAVNIARARTVIRTAAALLVGVSVAAAPALTYAQHIGGAGGVGGHIGGVPHMGGAPHMGGGAPHMAMPHFGGGAPMGAARYHVPAYGGVHMAHPGYAAAGHVGVGSVPAHISSGYATGRVGAGYAGGSAYYHGAHYWGGGYWHGAYWPYCYYRPGWVWYYPVLPYGYATFWWGAVPYYYYNNLYYTWSPGYNGYVVTDPPPSGGSYDDSGAAPDGSAAPEGPAGSDVYVYPRNGQSEQQASTDRYECHSWAVNQTGFDPTRSQQNGTGTVGDYRRAMIACLDARGYSAR